MDTFTPVLPSQRLLHFTRHTMFLLSSVFDCSFEMTRVFSYVCKTCELLCFLGAGTIFHLFQIRAWYRVEQRFCLIVFSPHILFYKTCWIFFPLENLEKMFSCFIVVVCCSVRLQSGHPTEFHVTLSCAVFTNTKFNSSDLWLTRDCKFLAWRKHVR